MSVMDANPAPLPGPGTTFESTTAGVSAIGHRVSVANVREAHRVTIEAAPPRVGVGPLVGEPAGPFFTRLVRAGQSTIAIDLQVTGNIATEPIVVPFTMSGGTAGVHYQFTTQSPITIPPGQSTVPVLVSFPAQSQWFRPRDLTFSLTDAGGGTLDGASTCLFRLRPTATAPVVSFDSASSSAPEGGGTVTAGLSLDAAALDPVTAYLEINSSSTASADDYTTTSLDVTFPAGQTAAGFRLTPVADGDVEGSETVVVDITNDDRTEQENKWSYSPFLHLPEGPEFRGKPLNASYPTDNLYKDLNPQTGWALDRIVDGRTPDGRDLAYRFAVSSTSRGTSKVGKSFWGNQSDGNQVNAGGANQYIPVRSHNILSVYVKKPDDGFAARYFGLDLFDRVAMVNHRARFEWSGTTPVLYDSDEVTEAGVLTGQPYDDSQLGNGWHRIYMRYSTTGDDLGNGTNRFLEAFSQTNGEQVELNRGKGVIMAWPQFENNASITPYQRCEGSYFSAWGGCTRGATSTHTFTITD